MQLKLAFLDPPDAPPTTPPSATAWIDEAVARAFVAALEPAKIAATVAAAERLEADRETALKQWRLGVERASFEASRAERRYRAVDPDNRLVARGLERDWDAARQSR